MPEQELTLPASVTGVRVEDKDIYLVGTAHVSKESVEDVRRTIEAVQPDAICIELCEPRLRALIEKGAWEKMNIFKVIREKKAIFLLAQLIMSSFYRQLGEKLGVQPGAEMLEGVRLAEKSGAQLILADRKIEITLKRVWGYLKFRHKVKLMVHLMAGIFTSETIDEELIEKIKTQDQLESLMESFTKSFPDIKKRLIDERDIYLSQKIRQAPGRKVVAIVGAGHIVGIEEHIQSEQSLDDLLEIPPKSLIPRILKWAIPAAIITLLVWGFFKDGAAHSAQNIYIWVMVNGLLSAIGAAVALGHPLAVLAAFVGAPLTSLNPLVAAGWVAGLVQAFVRKPTVADFQDLSHATSTVRGFWTNPVTKILLVVCLANLGSVLGTWIAGSWIFARSV